MWRLLSGRVDPPLSHAVVDEHQIRTGALPVLVIDSSPQVAGQVREQTQWNGGKVEENVDGLLDSKQVQQLLRGVVAVIRASSFEKLHFPLGQTHVIVEIGAAVNNLTSTDREGSVKLRIAPWDKVPRPIR
ncbi:MAG TPA: hypothetical protein VGK31_07620 [Thermoanaerobaculia bacterium]